MAAGERGEEHQQQGDGQPGHDPAARARAAPLVQQRRPRPANEAQRGDGDKRFAQTDEGVDAQHGRQHDAQAAGAAEGQQQGHNQGRAHDRQPGRRAGQQRPRPRPAAVPQPVDKPGQEAGHDAHDQHVGPHDQQPAVLEQQRLDGDDGRHG